MKEFTAEAVRIETASALEAVWQAQLDRKYLAYIGLDVHKETIAVPAELRGSGGVSNGGTVCSLVVCLVPQAHGARCV